MSIRAFNEKTRQFRIAGATAIYFAVLLYAGWHIGGALFNFLGNANVGIRACELAIKKPYATDFKDICMDLK